MAGCQVNIFAFLELEPRLNIKTDLTGQAKLSIFQKSQFAKYYKKNFLSIFLNNKIDTFEDRIKSDDSCKNGLDIKNLEY